MKTRRPTYLIKFLFSTSTILTLVRHYLNGEGKSKAAGVSIRNKRVNYKARVKIVVPNRKRFHIEKSVSRTIIFFFVFYPQNSHSMSSLVCLEQDFHYYEIVGRDISGRPLRFHRSLYQVITRLSGLLSIGECLDIRIFLFSLTFYSLAI